MACRLLLWGLVGLGLGLGQAGRAEAGAPESPMYRDPELVLPPVVPTFPAGLAERWVAALDRPDAEVPARAAAAIARAHQLGMPGLAEAAVPPLTRALDGPARAPVVRAAAARALVALDARAAAPLLLKHADAEPGLRDLVEPALARWDHRPARAAWLERLADPPPYRRAHLLAMRGLAAVKEDRAADPLRAIARSGQAAGPYRVDAARALGVIRTAGSEADAEGLLADPTPLGVPARLAAAAMLRHHSGEQAVRLLQALVRDPEPAVAADALARLVELDPALAEPVLPAALASPGADVRRRAVEALARLPAAAHVAVLGERLADPHPAVRDDARRGLAGYAGRPDLRDAVIRAGVAALAAADWRGQEQAAVLLAQLGHRPAAPRLVELLGSPRPEPAIAAAAALRELAVPDTRPAALAHVRRRHEQLRADGRSAGLAGFAPDQLDRQLAQLVQFIGAAKYAPADAELRALFPRFLQAGMPPVFSPVGPETRAAAVWALGHIHAGRPDDALVGPIQERLTGDGQMGRDDERVRRMAAVTLARLRAMSSLPALRDEAGDGRPSRDVVVHACRWAVSKFTGGPLPPPGVYQQPHRDWFLAPAR